MISFPRCLLPLVGLLVRMRMLMVRRNNRSKLMVVLA